MRKEPLPTRKASKYYKARTGLPVPEHPIPDDFEVGAPHRSLYGKEVRFGYHDAPPKPRRHNALVIIRRHSQ